jgi:ubiquinone/menaquinone biosynthesis C-methylase UbiE
MARHRRVDSAASFEFSDFDWESYEVHRPKYPKALYDIIFKYHRKTGGRFGSALDVGAGIGIVTRELMKKFKLVTLSDPAYDYIRQARECFCTVPASRLHFLQRKAEQLHLVDFMDGQVDMIAAGMSLHWTDQRVAIPRMAALLKPNGTFAAWLYGIQAVVGGKRKPEVETAIQELLRSILKIYASMVDTRSDEGMIAVMNARFDNFDFDPAVWKNVQRIHAHPALQCVSNDPIWPTAKSNIRPGETVMNFKDQSIISRVVDYEGVVGWMSSLNPEEFTPEYLPKEFEDVKKALNGGSVKLEYSFVLVLATKR